MQVDAKTLQGWVDYVEKTQPMIEKAAALEQAVTSIANALVTGGFIDQTKQAEAVTAMQDPAKLAEVITKVVQAGSQKQASAPTPTPMGGPVKSGSQTAPAKRNRSEADEVYLRRLGFL